MPHATPNAADATLTPPTRSADGTANDANFLRRVVDDATRLLQAAQPRANRLGRSAARSMKDLMQSLTRLNRACGLLTGCLDTAFDVLERFQSKTLVGLSSSDLGPKPERVAATALYAFLHALTEKTSYVPESARKYERALTRKLYSAVSILRLARRQRWNRPLTLMNAYELASGGAPKRTIEHFAEYGMSVSAQTLRSIMREILELHEELTPDLRTIRLLCSDNFGINVKGPAAGYINFVTHGVLDVPYKVVEYL